MNEDTLKPLVSLIQWLRSISGVTSGDVVIIRVDIISRDSDWLIMGYPLVIIQKAIENCHLVR